MITLVRHRAAEWAGWTPSARRLFGVRLPLRALTGLAVALSAAALVSCVGAAGQPAAGPSATARTATPGHPATSGAASSSATGASAASLPSLTPAQLAGQRVIYSYTGLTPPATLLRWIRHGEVGGVIFFGGNISSRAQITGVISELDKANASPDNPLRARPLLLMTDQEGGLVRRLPGAPVLSEKQIGESAHPAAAATRAGTGAGKNLAGAGMNVNLAPVLDVFRKPGDFDDQFGRSYSMNARVVSRLGASFIRAQQATGVAATAKHFPGLGAAAASQNTDTGPVTLNLSRHTLRTDDEYPYRAAIAAGVKLVMVSWATYPALAPTPAGLSSAVVQGELRQRLGFRGVTITDALEAGALTPFGTIGHRAILAARAGMDLILCSGQKASEGQRARDALANAITTGVLSRAGFHAALARVTALRSSLASPAPSGLAARATSQPPAAAT
jgi:beta-N-acetylhexosaminidase